jgi:cytochrome c oxidase cbb3-type subunit 3
MRYRQVVECLVVLLACIASGTLECGGVELTVSQRHGAETYGRMCAVCHGRDGEGYAADQAPGIMRPRFLASATDDFLRRAIENGRSGTTMSAWSRLRAGPLTRDDANALVSYLRSAATENATLDERPASGNVQRGTVIFARECAKCHGEHGTGGPNVNIGNAELLASASDGFLRYAIAGGRPGTVMPAFAKSLGDGGIDDVIALLRSWQAESVGKPLPPAPKAPPLPLGPVPLNPKGPEPVGFNAGPATTPADVVKHQLDRGARMALLDARAPSDYLGEHIAGAVSVPFYDPDPYLAALPKSAWLVCYCACPHAESGQLARKLAAAGFTKVTVLDEGLGVWRARKYPTHAGIDQ